MSDLTLKSQLLLRKRLLFDRLEDSQMDRHVTRIWGKGIKVTPSSIIRRCTRAIEGERTRIAQRVEWCMDATLGYRKTPIVAYPT